VENHENLCLGQPNLLGSSFKCAQGSIHILYETEENWVVDESDKLHFLLTGFKGCTGVEGWPLWPTTQLNSDATGWR
jgi:hypothetical protein